MTFYAVTELTMLTTHSLKIVILFTLLIVTFVICMLPLVVLKLSNRHRFSSDHRRLLRGVVSMLSCLAAGVFIGVCLLDLFPEVEETIVRAMDEAGIQSTFPVAEFVVVIGFVLLLFVEQFVLTWKAHVASDELVPLLNDLDSLGSSYSSIGPPSLPAEVAGHGFDSSEHVASGVMNSSDAMDNTRLGEEEEEDVHNEQAHSHSDPSSHSIVRSLVLVLALSVHSLFEGLAIGLQPTADDTVQLFIALALHKCILAFSLGLNMVQSKLSTRAIVVSSVIFSVASPVGNAVGIAILDQWSNGTAAKATVGALQGLACGTFIYIIFFEILPHEFMKKRVRTYPHRMLKVLFLVIGVSIVVGVMFLDRT